MMGRTPMPVLLALVTTTVACPSSSSNSFQVFRDGGKRTYDRTTVRVDDREAQLILYAFNTRDPLPDAADDESSDSLRIAFDKEAARQLALDQDHVISGEGTWTDVPYGFGPSDVMFTGAPTHTDAVEHLFFRHQCFGCFFCDSGSSSLKRDA
jgi:hypothetical protein